MYKIVLLSIFFIFSLNINAQYSDADILVRSAKKNFEAKKYDNALKILSQAKKVDKYNVDIYFLYGEIYYDMHQLDKVIEVYTEATKEIGGKRPIMYLLLGNTLITTGRYEEAQPNLERYLKNKNANKKYIAHVERDIQVCKFAINAKQHPVPFEPENLGSGVNSKYDEYLPALNAEENTLVFTRRIPKLHPNPYGDSEQEDFFVSHKEGSDWGKSKSLGSNVNTQDNEGAQSLSTNGKYLFFTACNRPKGYGGCDIYLTRKDSKGNWSKPMNMGSTINSKYWESQPSISPDSKTLYFTSNRPGGKGKLDIWKSTIGKEGKFGNPVNLGDSVNTPYNEISPFIHPDNTTLYYASDGKIGMGGLDIFMIKKVNDSIWGSTLNLGYPINTFADENSLIVNAKGNKAYYASDIDKGHGGLDLYSFDLYKEAQPQPVTYLKGKIYDSKTKLPLSAKFELIDLETNELIIESSSSKKTGEFLICIPANRNYALNVDKEQYIFYSDNFSLKNADETAMPFVKDIPLSKIEKGNKVVLKNIFFETDSYVLKDESIIELNKLISFLNNNKAVRIEIGGYTDNVGSDEHNQQLSENRAKSVYEYLINEKIVESRLSYKGYGETLPISTNDTEKGRAQNRRTEFTIL